MLLLEHGSKHPDSISFGKVASTNSNKQGEHKQGAKDKTQVDLSCIAIGVRVSMVSVYQLQQLRFMLIAELGRAEGITQLACALCRATRVRCCA